MMWGWEQGWGLRQAKVQIQRCEKVNRQVVSNLMVCNGWACGASNFRQEQEPLFEQNCSSHSTGPSAL
eukprot:1241242-Amphidinium_carterae.1